MNDTRGGDRHGYPCRGLWASVRGARQQVRGQHGYTARCGCGRGEASRGRQHHRVRGPRHIRVHGRRPPDFDRLLKDCHEGRINLIIVYYISRLSRMDPLDAIPIVTELLNLGVTIVSLTEGEFRKGNLMDLIHLILRLDAAHSESKNKSDAVRGAKKTAWNSVATWAGSRRTAFVWSR